MPIELETPQPKPEPPAAPYKPGTYKIKHIVFKQKDLLYPDVEELLAILSELGDEFKEAFSEEDAKFFQFGQKIFEKKLLPRLFALILVPENGNPLRALLNKFWMRHYKIDAGNVINVMTTEQWKAVLADFFIVSSQWIASWLHSAGLFGLGSSETSSNSSASVLMKTILNPLTMPLETRSGSFMPPAGATEKSSASGSAPS